MIILEKRKFIFCRRNQKLLVHSKALRNVLKMKQEKPLKPFVLIMVENTAQKSLKFFVMLMTFKDSSHPLIHPNKMAY